MSQTFPGGLSSEFRKTSAVLSKGKTFRAVWKSGFADSWAMASGFTGGLTT